MNEPTNTTADERTGIGEAVTTALHQPTFLRVMLFLAATVVVLVGVRLSAPGLTPILFAVVLALLFTPVYSWLRRRRIPTPLALLIMLGEGPAMMSRLRSSSSRDYPQIARLATVGQSVVRQFGLRAIVNLATGAGVTVYVLGVAARGTRCVPGAAHHSLCGGHARHLPRDALAGEPYRHEWPGYRCCGWCNGWGRRSSCGG